MTLATCSVTMIESGKTVTADILKKSDKSIRVALRGSDIVLNLNRTDVRKPYIGSRHGMEFATLGNDQPVA